MEKQALSVSRIREVFSYDPSTGFLTRLIGGRTNRHAWGSLDAYGYLVGAADGHQLKAHQIAWAHYHGEWATALIDHINGEPGDNRIENLRLSDKRHNAQNMKAARVDNKHGLLGVTRKFRRYRATIFANGKQRLIGSYTTPEEAHAAYLEAKASLHSGFVP